MDESTENETNGGNADGGLVRGEPPMEEPAMPRTNEAVVTEAAGAGGVAEVGTEGTEGTDGTDGVEYIDGEEAKLGKPVVTGGPGQGRKAKFGIRLTAAHAEIFKGLNDCEMISDIAQRIGVSRSGLLKYIQAQPDLKLAYEDAREKKLDLMEKVVLNIATIDSANTMTENGAFAQNDGRVMTANLNAAKFWLERLGAKRGWNAKLETNEVGNGGTRVPMIFLGDVSEAAIAKAEAEVKAANEAVGIE